MEQITPIPGERYNHRYGEGEFHVVAIVKLEQRVNAYTYEWVDGVQFTDGLITHVTTVRRFLSQFELILHANVLR